MNSRDYKIFRPNCYYHIYNRGNNKEAIFLDEQDYWNFLKRVKLALFGPKSVSLPGRVRIKALPEGAFDVLAYCLMPNHFHFLIRQNLVLPVSKLVTGVCTSYAKYFNLKYNRIGNLFQDAFKAKIVDSDKYLMYLTAYIHNNPSKPLDYDYSSLKDYLGMRTGRITDKGFILKMFGHSADEYKKFVLAFNEKDLKLVKDYLFEDDVKDSH